MAPPLFPLVLSQVDATAFQLRCSDRAGETTMTFALTHTSSLTDAAPTTWRVTRTVGCGVPVAVRLEPAARRGVAEGQRLGSYDIYMLEKDEELRVRPVFTDVAGRPFAAYDSLNLRWGASAPRTARLVGAAGALEAVLQLQEPGEVTVRPVFMWGATGRKAEGLGGAGAAARGLRRGPVGHSTPQGPSGLLLQWGGGNFAAGIFRRGIFRVSNSCDISHTIFRAAERNKPASKFSKISCATVA